MGRSVLSVDIHEAFTQAVAGRLEGLGIHNVTLETGDGVDGWDHAAPYDVIAVTGSVPAYRDAFERQLALGGRLFLIVGHEPVMEAMLITRLGKQEWTRESLFDTVVPPLLHSEPPPSFVF
jgi:protein-L-isoaspartate(D-aspartate) O-methyltransferase